MQPPSMQELFERDVECIVRFFSKKLGYVPERDEELEVIRPSFQARIRCCFGIFSVPRGSLGPGVLALA